MVGMYAAHSAGGVPQALSSLAIGSYLNIGSRQHMDHQRTNAQILLGHFYAGICRMELFQILLVVLHTALAVVGVNALHAHVVAPVLTKGGGFLVLRLLNPDLLEFSLMEALGVVVGVTAHDIADLHDIGDPLDELFIRKFLFHCIFHCVGLLS